MTHPPANPAKLLSDLFLRMLSADDMRRMATYAFPGNLERTLPGNTASTLNIADAIAAEIVLQHGYKYLWPYLLKNRPQRAQEIQTTRHALEKALRAEVEADPASVEQPAASGPVRLLFVSSCPLHRQHLTIDQELRQIHKQLDDRFDAKITPAATFADLRKALRKHKPQILHIACHGTPDGALVFSTEQNAEDLIAADTFVELLAILKNDLRLVILNVCDSAEIINKLAPKIDLLISMRGQIIDTEAVGFSSVLYEGLAGGDTVEQAFALALNDMRHNKADADIPTLTPPDGPMRQHRFVRP